jgi:crotonobetainyl-CoA:carnitine CoA-transferase CaiB-like acyl-CoA transferase
VVAVSGPLSGVRIVDLTTMISGPIATRMLADQGADVLKIEAPGGGDLTRQLGNRRGGVSAVFATSNRNKRSLVLDLKQPRGRALLDRLVAGADAFVQNFRPGTEERMGIGEAALRRVRPDLVYVSISGFGETGPYAHKRVYDPVIQALSGLAAIQKDRDSGRPRMVRTIIPDKLTAVTAAQAITAALFARERTGRGTHVRLAMLDASVAFLWPEGMAGLTWRGDEVEGGRYMLAQDLVFETADGYITAGAVSDAEWLGLVRVLDRPEWLEDPRFKTAGGRVAHAGERLGLMQQVLRTRPSAAWLEELDAAGVPCAPVLSISEVPGHPQVVANELIVESDHPLAGPMRQPRPAARFGERRHGLGETAHAELAPAPALGEHTEEVLGELGVTSEEIRDLRDCGAVA